MAKRTLYAYVDGADLDDLEALLMPRLERFVSEAAWTRETWVVNQRQEPDPTAAADDLPLWELGLNHELPDTGQDAPGWFDEIERMASFLGKLAVETEREFVLGVGDADSGTSDDAFFIEAQEVDLALLRTTFGADSPSK